MNSSSTRTRRARIMTSSLSLSQDSIVFDILSRLPVKSVTRFKSVSKNWTNLTSTSAFVSAHLRRSSSEKNSLLIRRYNTQSGSEHALLLYKDPTRSSRVSQLDIPDERVVVCFPRIVGSVDGLVCLDVSPCYAFDFILWNPVTKQFKRLPYPLITSSKSSPIWLVFVGFGFDSLNNDYKLVRIVSFKTNASRVEVFSWKEGVWKEILDESFDLTGLSGSVLSGSPEGVVAGGSLNWLAMGLQELEDQKFVVSFNLETEVFKRVQLPPIARYGNVKVMSHRGLLAIAVYPILYAPAYNMNRFEFWVLDGGDDGFKDWTKMVAIQTFAKGLVPMRTWRDRELMIKIIDVKDREPYQSLLLYDPVNEGHQRLAVDGVYMCLEGWGYVESLVSVDGRSLDGSGA